LRKTQKNKSIHILFEKKLKNNSIFYSNLIFNFYGKIFTF
jgi:hypothetical protein